MSVYPFRKPEDNDSPAKGIEFLSRFVDLVNSTSGNSKMYLSLPCEVNRSEGRMYTSHILCNKDGWQQEATDVIKRANKDGRNLYFNTSSTDKMLEASKRGTIDDVRFIPGICLDLDLRHESATKDLPTFAEAKQACDAMPIAPHLVVASGR